MDADGIRDVERARLRSLVDGCPAEDLHADGFRIVTPSGHAWSRQEYVGGIASGDIDYRRFEPISEIEVMLDTDLAVLRYRSAIEISVDHRDPVTLEAWHQDVYRRTNGDSWQIHWSQATAIS